MSNNVLDFAHAAAAHPPQPHPPLLRKALLREAYNGWIVTMGHDGQEHIFNGLTEALRFIGQVFSPAKEH